MKVYTGTNTLESMSQAKFYNQWVFKKFKRYLRGEILDVGCGIGNFTSILSNYGKVSAIDIDKELIKNIEDNKNSAITSGFGDIERGEYFFKNKCFDAIVCLNVLEHIKNDIKALENLHKLLNKKGNLILLVPISDFLYGAIDRNIGHFRRYDPKEIIKKLEDIGFQINYSRKLNFIGAIGWFIAGKLLKNKHVDGGKIQIFNILAPLFLFFEKFIEPPIGTSVLIIAQKVKE